MLKGRITKSIFTAQTCPVPQWSQAHFHIQYIKAKEERRTHWDTQTQNSIERSKDERRNQTSVSLSLLSTNHSKHLFMLDLYSTPPTPPSLLNKTQLYEFTPICTIWTDYPLFWHVTQGNLCTMKK